MKYTIYENQYGYLIKNGRFQKLLGAGKYRFPQILGYQVEIIDTAGLVDTKEIPLQILMQDETFAKSTVRVQIPDDSIALHYIDGMFENVLLQNEHVFWNIHQKHTFTLINITQPEVGDSVPTYLMAYVPGKLYHKIDVQNGEVALLYYDNILQKQLTSGTYYYWNYQTKVTHKLFDLKVQQLDIAGQEILTADKVGIRLNVTCNYRITDAVALTEKISNLTAQLYTYVQMAVREYVGKLRLDQLLEQKDEIGHLILELLRIRQPEFYVEFSFAGIKDIILPGEIRDIMNTVLVAEKTAQANVISRREEVASTRSLLNTAKLMDENQTLYKLKELEYLERICDRVGTISLSGAGGVLEQLEKLVNIKVQ